jgi:hypothetical protein
MNKEKLTELVYINLGRASMCWSEIPKGVFDSTKAAELGKEIMDAIEKYIEDQEPGWKDPMIEHLENEEKESEWQRRRRLEVMKEAKMNPNPDHYASRNITVGEIHQIYKEMMESEKQNEIILDQENAIKTIRSDSDYVGEDDMGNSMYRHKGSTYTLDKSFKRILSINTPPPPHWWWNK